jgi:serine/threonine protein phosphatase PrpC
MTDGPGNKLMSPFPFCWAAVSDIGKVRQENQDSLLVEPEIGLFLVTDGMGGHRGGGLASKIVAEDLPPMIESRLDELKTRSATEVRSLLKSALAEQSRQVQMEGISEDGYKDMGTTVVVALLIGERAYIANVGDSRIYRFRKGRLRQLTKDHSVISELLDLGQIEPEETRSHEAQGQVTHYIGMEEKAYPYVRSFLLKEGDRLLLCTDGLTDLVADDVIAAILGREPDCQAVCETLVSAANTAGGTDNTTVIVADWLGHRQQSSLIDSGKSME